MARRTKRFEEAQETKMLEQLLLLLVVVGSDDEAEIQRERLLQQVKCFNASANGRYLRVASGRTEVFECDRLAQARGS